MRNKLNLYGLLVVALPLAVVTSAARGQQFDFPMPSDDRWHYPFNFTPGTRAITSSFGALFDQFNDRDGIVLVAWETGALIPPGMGPENYNIDSIDITLTNQANEFSIPDWQVDLTVDEWFTHDVNLDGIINADGIPAGEPGDTDGESDDPDPGRTIDLFGVAFDEGAPFTEATWIETSFYLGANGNGNVPRNPYPFEYDENGNRLHVEDCVKGLHNEALGVFSFTPQPWAIGIPQGYTPGVQVTPFDVTFSVDLTLSGGGVKRYFQEQLNNGRIIVAITSLAEVAVQGSSTAVPAFYSKEGVPLNPNAAPAALSIVLSDCAKDGDLDDSGTTDLGDIGLFAAVAVGNNSDPALQDAADLNCDGAVNGGDIPLFMTALLD